MKTDISSLAEQMCRIEHKLDLVLESLARNFPEVALRLVGDPHHFDPLTQESVNYHMDLMKGHVVRSTSQGTGIQPLLPSQFQNPISFKKGTGNGDE